MATARLVSSRTHIIPKRLKVSELFFDVPLDHSIQPNSSRFKTIRIFGRSVEKLEKPAAPPAADEKPKQLPWFVYLQGDPGFGCGPPQDYGFTGLILDRGYKLLFLDQRGMGLSTPVTAQTLARQGNVKQQVDYLKLFRADTAVKDWEAIRKCLTADYPEEKKKWSLVGQSYGGFVATTYLSYAPEGLREVFTTGGLPPVTQNNPDELYRRLYKKVVERNLKFYEKYPEDIKTVQKLTSHLHSSETNQQQGAYNDGIVKSPRDGYHILQSILAMGINFGFHGGIDTVHDVLLKAVTDLDLFGSLTKPTLHRIEATGSFEDHVLYAVLHESIYCQKGGVSNWSANRVTPNSLMFNLPSGEQVISFRGEMVFRDDFAFYPELVALKEVAESIADVDDWPNLYDIDQLKRNEVPVYSATYVDDMYVDFEFAQETANIIKGAKTYVTNTMYHNALRDRTEELFKNLFALRDEYID